MRKWVSAFLITVVLGVIAAPLVAAHPLGNFTVNRYSRIEVGPEEVRLRYVLDLAEIPTLQELRAAGIAPGSPSAAERQSLLAAQSAQLAAGAKLSINGEPIPWSVLEASLEFLPGQADLDTIRLALTLGAKVILADGVRIEYRDTNYPGRVGWHEIVLRGRDGMWPITSTVPPEDSSDELRAYPIESSRPPLDVSSATAMMARGADPAGHRVGSPAGRPEMAPGAVAPRALSPALDPRLGHVVGALRGAMGGDLAAPVIAVLIAVGLGAAHALEPGHGKTIVGGYLVGSRGTARHALLLGIVVTITHTLGVYVLAVVTLGAAQYVVPERLYPILGMASGLMIIAIGSWLVRSRVAVMLPGRWREPVPAPAMAGRPLHSHGGGAPHRHILLGADGAPVTLKGLLALGVSGGIVPCPGALVVLLAAISFQNIGLGMLLVAAFSVGLAGVLTGLGLLMVYGGRRLAASPLGARFAGSLLERALPVLSGVAITAAGIGITTQAARAVV